MSEFDFSGYATRNDLLCGDGRTIRKDAFKAQDGEVVPLIYNHDHNNPDAVLGHALLENRDDGVYAYCKFNETDSGKAMKEAVRHGDVRSLSIYANKLKQIGGDVIHGMIRELSLVVAGANPGAFVDFVMAHGDETEDALYAGYDENIMLYHSDEKPEEVKKMDKEDPKKETENKESDGEELTIEKIKETVSEMTEEQQNAVYALVGLALEENSDEGEKDMKHNVFENEVAESNVLSHSDQKLILERAKSNQCGSFQAALAEYAEENALAHGDGDPVPASGFPQTGTYNVTSLFPEYKEVRPGAPELITYDQGWVNTVMNKVHKSPISRIRTSQVDIRGIEELRAKGYKKGTEKKLSGNFNLVRRTTDPQTVYVKSALHRDDIIDITDFDYVNYLYNIDSLMLKEELATAIMLGDGRQIGAEGKIEEDKIRPIWTDDDLYTIHVDLDIAKAKQELNGSNTGANFGENYIYAEAMVDTVLHARENYKGSGQPDLYCTPNMLNKMLLARDLNGRRIYGTVSELAAALNVGNIYTVEQFEGKTRTSSEGTKKLLCIVTNLADYSLGATKGGEISHFTDFDIDFNQMKSLIETRCSGALTRVYSAIAVEEPVVTTAG